MASHILSRCLTYRVIWMILQTARGLAISFSLVFSSLIYVLIESKSWQWQQNARVLLEVALVPCGTWSRYGNNSTHPSSRLQKILPDSNPNINNTATKWNPGSVSVKQLEKRPGDTAVINGNYVASTEASKEATNAVAMGHKILNIQKHCGIPLFKN